MNRIDPTARIDPSAQLGEDNHIGPYVIIGPNVVIGNNNRIEAHAVLGARPSDTRPWPTPPKTGVLFVGSDCEIREGCTVELSRYEGRTEIGDGCYIMPGTRIQHDVCIAKRCNIAANVVVTGMVKIMEGAYLGAGAVVIPCKVIGPYALLAAGSTLVENLPPYALYITGKEMRPNRFILRRDGLTRLQEGLAEWLLGKEWEMPPEYLSRYQPYQDLCQRYHEWQHPEAPPEHDPIR